MATLVFADHKEGKILNSSYEAVSYAKKMGSEVIALTYGSIEGDGGLGNYGADKVLVASSISNADSQQLSSIISETATSSGCDTVIFSHDQNGKLIAPRVAVKMNAGLVAGAIEIPDTSNGFTVKKNVFSGKAIANVKINTSNKVISVLPNSIGLIESGGSANVESIAGDGGSAGTSFKGFNATSTGGHIPLPEAELVVSAGRGLKGPENWNMVEELASKLNAATACSRPVADIGWRPHHEHVGQTGLAISPNLYIAVGISGAIQHLAGVNRSKVIVVVNTDPEAPFFKAADYGIIGDAFEVVPKLIAAVDALN